MAELWCWWVLLAVLCGSHSVTSLRLRAEDEGSGSRNGTGDEPVLSAEAIANISVSALGLFVMGSALCYLIMCFNKEERMQRVRMAQERNRQITRQIEAAKQKRRAQQQEAEHPEAGSQEAEEGRAVGSLLFSQVHRSHESPGRTSRDQQSSPTQPLVSSPSHPP